MDPEYSLQDVVRCHLCETPVPTLHCVICNTHLCKDCEKKHISGESKEHNMVSFKYWKSTPMCKKHSGKLCEFYCKQCNIPICSLCASYNEHQYHDALDIFKALQTKRQALLRDLKELEESIYPQFQKIASTFPVQKAEMNEHSQKLTTAINKHGEHFHNEIDSIMKKLKSDLDEMDSKHLSLLNEHEDEITCTISEITQNIVDLKKLRDSNDVSLISTYKSRNAEFRRLPPELTISLSKFTPQEIKKEQFYKQFGSLSAVSIRVKHRSHTMDSPAAKSSVPGTPLIDVSRIITEINTNYGRCKISGSCLNDENIWACGEDKIMRLFNLKGEIVNSIQTKSGNFPDKITVTSSGDLVYTDYSDRTVNLVKNTHIETLIRLQGWKPLNVCCTSSDKLLVVMISDAKKQTKVVRYFGSIEEQSIQYDDKGHPLFSAGTSKYITEHKTLDICVSDNGACSVLVVNQAGKLRFTYTGRPATIKGSFSPHGITTDSHSQILVADSWNNCIHILNKDGKFLRYINNWYIQHPCDLCMDSRDFLFVFEHSTGKVKKIKYYV